MKIAVTGKGGVGKTTFAALLCHIYEAAGTDVIAVDADPDSNLGSTLGISVADIPRPITDLKELIQERTGADPAVPGSVYKLNPEVSDIPDKYCYARGSLKFLLMGTVKAGGKGCVCPESAFMKTLLAHLAIAREQCLVVDMEAGLEHLGRGTTRSMDALVAVVRPDFKSIETAHRIEALWKDLGGKKIFFVGNEIRGPKDRDFILSNLPPEKIVGFLPESEKVRLAGIENRPPFDDPEMISSVETIKSNIESEIRRINDI